MAKELKAYYPKDIAASAYYLGISPKEVENLTTYMSPGAKDAFEKHYTKLLKSVEKAGPEKIAIGESPISFLLLLFGSGGFNCLECQCLFRSRRRRLA